MPPRFFPNLLDPVDFSLTAKQLSLASCPSLPVDFAFLIGTQSYPVNRRLAQAVFTKVNGDLTAHPDLNEMRLNADDPHYDFRLVQQLLAGEVITITEENARFLNYVAHTLGSAPLAGATDNFLQRYRLDDLVAPPCSAKFRAVLISALCVLSVPLKVILFLCELVGLAIALGFLFGLFLIPVTSGVLSPRLSATTKILLMVPWIFFNENVVTLMELIVYYMCTGNHFIADSAFPKHVYLLRLIKRLWPCCRAQHEIAHVAMELYTGDPNDSASFAGFGVAERRRTLFVGKRSVYNLVLGVLFVFLLFTMMIDDLYRYTIEWLAIYLPYIVTAVIVFLYAIHAFLSVFKRARENFAELGDFSDPFLCSMYFRANPWINAMRQIRHTIARHSAQWNGTHIEIEEQPVVPIWKAVLLAIFSKFTLGIYVTIALIIFLSTNHSMFTPGQLFAVAFSIIIICFPVMVSVTFPLLIVGRWFSPARSDAEVEASDRWIHTEDQRMEWLEAWFLWSRKSLPIRLMRVFWISFQFLVLFIALTAVIAFTSPASPPAAPARAAAATVPRLLNPICYINLSGFDMVQMSAFAEASYATEEDLNSMFDYFMGENWSEWITDISEPITDTWWHSRIRHFRTNVSGEVAHIFSIRGTMDMIDVMADIELWAASFIMNIMKMTIPIFSGYADNSRYFIGYTMELSQYMFSNFSLINGYVSEAESALAGLNETSNVILAGHSLGGGLAKILAAKNGYQAYSISGPGITAVEAVYGWKSPHVANSFINVVPNLDPIAGVDRPSGSTFMIPCQAGVFACHDVWRSQCMLATLCGQMERYRDWCNSVLGADEVRAIEDLGTPYPM